MPDYDSRNKFEKNALDIWENEGGNLSISERKLTEIKPPFKSIQGKERQPQLAYTASKGRSLQIHHI